MSKKIIFENIHTRWNEISTKTALVLGPKKMIAEGIPWDKVAYARMEGHKEYLSVYQKKGDDKIYVVDKDTTACYTKEELAWWWDLWDKDGTLLSIAFVGL